MEELACVLASGGLILMASSFVNSTKDQEIDVISAETRFNIAHADAISKNDKIILSSCFNDYSNIYSGLKAHLSSMGITLITKPGEQFATINFQVWMKNNLSFEYERKIQAALLAEGLVLCPGEACGLTEPGYFRICVPTLTTEQTTTIINKLNKVSLKFDSNLKKRSLTEVETSSPVVKQSKKVHENTMKIEDEHDNDDQISVAESTTDSIADGTRSSRKKRKN